MANTTKKMCILASDYKIAADSHTGLVRDGNEDSFAYYAEPGKKNFVVSVADGIGGHESGDIASALCVRMQIVTWRNQQYGDQAREKELRGYLRDAIVKSNEVIHSLNKTYNIQHPMGTTVVSGVFTPDKVLIGHAGDSRCYRTRDGKLEQLTKDHSIVQELVRKKVIKPEQAKNHPFAHIISKSVGPAPVLEPEINVFDRRDGDRYLFCSDGVNIHVDDKEIEDILIHAPNPEQVVKELLYDSLRGGGEDNITIICVFS